MINIGPPTFVFLLLAGVLIVVGALIFASGRKHDRAERPADGCPHCEHRNPQRAKFCGHCGQRLP